MEGKEKRVEEKEVEKREKGKVVLEKGLFVFLFTLQFESFCQLPGSVLPTHSLWESGGLLRYRLWPMAVEGM